MCAHGFDLAVSLLSPQAGQYILWERGSPLSMSTETLDRLSLVPRPTLFSVLQFALTIIHRCGRAAKNSLPHPCIIVNPNRRTENGVGLGTRLGHAELLQT